MARTLLSDEQWELIKPHLPDQTGRPGPPAHRLPPHHNRGHPVDRPHGRAVARSAGAVREVDHCLSAIPPLVAEGRVPLGVGIDDG